MKLSIKQKREVNECLSNDKYIFKVKNRYLSVCSFYFWTIYVYKNKKHIYNLKLYSVVILKVYVKKLKKFLSLVVLLILLLYEKEKKTKLV